MSDTFLGKLHRGLVALTAGADGEIASRLEKHFALLGKSLPDLQKQVSAYVVQGENSSVLSSLSNQAVQGAWRARLGNGTSSDEGRLFAPRIDWTAAQMKRLGEVFATLEPIRDGSCLGTQKSPDWLRHVMTHWLRYGQKEQLFDRLVQLVSEDELGVVWVLDFVFGNDVGFYDGKNGVDRYGGVADWLARNAEAVTSAVPDFGADERAMFAAAVGRLGLAGGYLEPLVYLATTSSNKARIAASQALTGAESAWVRDSLAACYAKASPVLRVELVEVAAFALGERAYELLAAWKTEESGARPLAALDRALGASALEGVGASEAAGRPEATPDEPADGPAGYRAIDGSFVGFPSRPPAPEASAIPAELFELLEPAVARFNAHLAAGTAVAEWRWKSGGKDSVGASELKMLRQLGEGSGVVGNEAKALDWIGLHDREDPGIAAFFGDERLSLWHSVRFGVAAASRGFQLVATELAGTPGAALVGRILQGADIRVVLHLWTRFSGDDPIAECLAHDWFGPHSEIDGLLWLALGERFDMLDEAMGMKPQSGAKAFSVRPALDLLALLPKVPQRYRQPLMMLASGTAIGTRIRSRALLRDAPGIDDAIAGLLGDGRQETRAGAAEWLVQRDARGQVAALRRVLQKERSGVVRAAMITALERLGDDVSDFFDSEAMIREAEAGLAKTRVPSLNWFPFGQIPALHWQDGTALDPRLPRWWVTLAAKLKQPGGTALFDLWLDRLAAGDAHRLGWMVLVSWIEQNTQTWTDEEANAYAVANVTSTLQHNIAMAQHYMDGASSELWPTDRNVVFDQLRRAKLGAYLGSAVDSKGILALATRVNGADVAQKGRQFLKDHGSRVVQAKALLDMLASNPASAALQVVLAAANRSKQLSVEEHAEALTQAIAERRGWTTEELADRTVPTGGLDDDGTLELDCGRDRVYSLRLGEADTLILLNTDGKEVKALPGPRTDKEKPVIEAAKKLLSSARKEVKQVFTTQRERLQEAMCLERQWKIEEWEPFIARHPLVGRLAQRLIWLGVDSERRVLSSFRPLGDGSYTDAADAPVDLAGFSRVQLAHKSLLDAPPITAWQRHLADYEVATPFDQIGRKLPVLADAQRTERVIGDREGWMIETFKLRGIATKLGYVRGAAGDGGWFTTYERPYRSAGLVAEVEFSGSPLPEENRPAALHALSFRQLRGKSYHGRQIELGKVPPVLLAECWQDLHDIAAKGTGFDPEWRQKGNG